ncbi:MAG: DNA polymerase I [Desulfovermiculus sp.]|nr:DNA polymerase I [Desulfovermiculus sp.]
MPLQETLDWDKPPLYLIDGSSFLYRAFYAFPDLSRTDGFPTNALFITLRILLNLIKKEHPGQACFVLDGKGPSFRQEIMPSYKAQRQKMPEPLSLQIEPLLQGVQLLGFPVQVADGAEADDVIATLCIRSKHDRPVVIVGSDKDLRQCLDTSVVLWDPGQRTERLITLQDFKQEEGLAPAQWPDYQALVGDSSDNIPGVPGVGPKTAKKLLARYPSLEALQANYDHLSAKEQQKLGPYMQAVFQYRELTRLKTDVSLDIEQGDLSCRSFNPQELRDFFQTYEFSSLIKELDADSRNHESSPARKEKESAQRIEPAQVHSIPNIFQYQVGLVCTGNDLLVGWEDQEASLPSSCQEMVRALAQCPLVFVPSFKELCEQDQGWEDLSPAKVFDLSLAAYLLSPEDRDYSWKRLLNGFLPQIGVHIENQALAALRIGQILHQRLEQAALLNLMHQLEIPLIPVLVRMQRRGVGIDLQAFEDFLQEVETDLERLTQSAYARAGQEFNLRSPQQLAEILFNRLGLRPSRKTPGGQPSTSVAVLEGLQHQHPIIKDIVEYRSLEKLRSTYLAPLPRQVHADGRVHTTFNNLTTATGRLSSSNPNLQNIPIRGQFGPRMRSCFVAQKNNSLVAADYSQIELRVLAHLSQEPHLIEAFAANEDIHSRTASLLLDKSKDRITADERRKAKTINFGLIYGMGPQKLSRELGISLNESKEFIEKYFSRLQKVRQFFEYIESQAKTNGSVTTIAGRRRLLPDINSRNENLAGQARRMAINTVVQGSAADIIKMAMLKVEKDQKLKDVGAELILQVHDELLLEVPGAKAKASGERAADLMSSVIKLDVPLIVEWGTGRSWAEAH